MAFRASNKTPVVVYERLKSTALNLKTYTNNRITAIQSQGLDADELENLYETVLQFKNTLSELSSVNGLAAYASDQEADPTYDVVAEFQTLSANLADVADYIQGAWPKDANGYLLAHQFVNDTLTPREFTPGELTTLVTKMELVNSSIS